MPVAGMPVPDGGQIFYGYALQLLSRFSFAGEPRARSCTHWTNGKLKDVPHLRTKVSCQRAAEILCRLPRQGTKIENGTAEPEIPAENVTH
jgi:hypothetical protein